MTTFRLRSLAIGTLALLMLAGNALSQTASPILNTLEVQRLVASSQPADHVRLNAHFAALADRYEADARRHTSMARASGGNPNRNSGAGMSAHCRRLAEINTQEAATLRELVVHHEQLAAGSPSTAPRDAARFEAGAGAAEPSEQELNALAAKANTPAEHRALAEYFETQARRYTSDANAHATIATSYRGTRIAQAAVHCDRIVALSREAAKEATAAAEMHTQLANVAR